MRPPRYARTSLLATAAVIAVVAAFQAVPPARADAPSPPAGWTTAFVDDFNGPAGTLPSQTNWRFSIGHGYPGGPPNWGTGEIAFHTDDPANVSVDGAGNLRITPLRDGNGNWTSARIETNQQDFRPPPGGVMRVEARLQMPNVTGDAALGYWPAFWMLNSPYRSDFGAWPGRGEFDIMENVNGLNNVWGVLHCGVAPGGPCDEFNGIGNSRPCPGSPCQSGFHTYRFEWDTSISPNQLRWYVDGQQYHTISQNQLPADTWNQMTNHAGYFIILNVAIGGGFPDGVAGFPTPTAATVPGRPMVVDYVAVWYRGGDSTPPTTPPPGGSRDAYSNIQAESFNAQSGVVVEDGTHIGFLSNGDWARYDNVDFGSTPPRDFVARVASGAPAGVSGLVEVRLDSPTSPPIGSFAIANTGGWFSWQEVPGNVSAVTGTRTVFLTFTSGQPSDFVNVDWFRFRR
ncbi:MAG TPA: glycoside hydrolase family 16 protein [Natronosporangium sp.]